MCRVLPLGGNHVPLTYILFGVILIAAVRPAWAEPQTDVAATSAAPRAPSSLLFYLDPGSATVRPKDIALLDQASRLYREGKPIVMIVSGSADGRVWRPIICSCRNVAHKVC